eukprot:5988269-Alexandrium_andersonii.AAC.1
MLGSSQHSVRAEAMLICRGTATLQQDCSKRSVEPQVAPSRGFARTGSGRPCAGLVREPRDETQDSAAHARLELRRHMQN